MKSKNKNGSPHSAEEEFESTGRLYDNGETLNWAKFWDCINTSLDILGITGQWSTVLNYKPSTNLILPWQRMGDAGGFT